MANQGKSSLNKNLRKGGMLGMVAALAMSGLMGGANLIKSATNLLKSKESPNTLAYQGPNSGTGKHRKAYIPAGGGKGISKRRIPFHPVNAGLPFNAEFGYLNGRLNGHALERYFNMVEDLHGPEKANKERVQAGYSPKAVEAA